MPAPSADPTPDAPAPDGRGASGAPPAAAEAPAPAPKAAPASAPKKFFTLRAPTLAEAARTKTARAAAAKAAGRKRKPASDEQLAEAEAEAPAPAAEAPAPAAETEPETKKRKYAEHGSYSSATKAKMAKKTAPTVEGWKEHHPWLVWDGDFDNGMACASCLATGKTGDAFTAEGGCTNFMLKSFQAHEKVHHVAKDQYRSLLYSIGPQLGPNRRQPNSPVGCETLQRGVTTSFSSGFTFFWTTVESPEATLSRP